MTDLSRQPETVFDKARLRVAKVPEVTGLFWLIKIMTTGMGETTSDFLVTSIDPVVAVGFGAILFVITLAFQISLKRYCVWMYWLAVVMVSIFGTMAADVVHVVLGIPYAVSTAFFAIVLGIVFLVWKRCEGTLSIHSVDTLRRELFYWATVSTTFALGTAAGDMTAATLGLGYFESGLVFAVFISIPAIFYWKRDLGEIPAFWLAYILTRPLGASFADWMGVGQERGGLALGTGYVSLTLAILIVVAITYIAAMPDKRIVSYED